MRIFLPMVAVLFFCIPAFAQENKGEKITNAPGESQASVVTEEDKEKLKEDALKLAEDFKEIFKEFSFVGKKILLVFVDSMGAWIETNYEKISKDQRERLRKFITELQVTLANIEELSAEKAKEALQELQDFLIELEKSRAPHGNGASGENGTRI